MVKKILAIPLLALKALFVAEPRSREEWRAWRVLTAAVFVLCFLLSLIIIGAGLW